MKSSARNPILDELLYACLARPAEEWEEAVAEACASHPALAPDLRRRLETLRSVGMADSKAPARVGEYELLHPIGGGTMGTVFLARRDGGTELVALKLLQPGLGFSVSAHKRFARERSVLARLHHPGIAAVREEGEVDGVPFLAMEYVEGESLAARIMGRDSPPERDEVALLARLGAGVAHALHAAHAAGLVHRDVKPGNIVVRHDGLPVLLDFGLAHDDAEDASRLTASDALLGSPAYIAPECVTGRAAGQAADVYALGVTLFEALTGRLPYVAPTREALFHRILREPVPNAHARNALVPKSLANVLETAMAKRPDRRYSTAEELGNDLLAWSDGRPVSARTPGLASRTSDWVGLNPLLSAFLALLVVGLTSTAWLLVQLSRGFEHTRALGLADAAANAEPELGVLLGAEAVELLDDPRTVSSLHAAVARYHRRVNHPSQNAPVFEVAFVPGGGVVSLSELGQARISDAEGNELGLLSDVEHVQPGSAVGEVIVTMPNGLFRWNGEELTPARDSSEDLEDTGLSEGARVLARSKDGTSCVVEERGRRSWYRRSKDGSFAGLEPLLTFGLNPSLFLPFGDKLAVLERKTTVRVFDKNGRLLTTIAAHGVYVEAIAVSPDGRLLASGDGDGVVRLFTVDGVFVGEFYGHRGHVTSLAFRADGESVVSGSYDRGVRAFAVRPGTGHVFDESHSPVVAVDACAGRLLWVEASGVAWQAENGSARRIATGVRRAVFVEGGERVFLVQVDGKTVFLGSEGESLETGDELAHLGPIEDLAAGRDVHGGEWLLAAFGEGALVRWERTGAAWSEAVLIETQTLLQTAHLSMVSERIVCGDRDGVVRVLDLSGHEVVQFQAHGDWVRSVRVSPDGARILTTSRDNSARLWELDGEPIAELRGHEATIARGVFSPDGNTLATCSTDHTVRLWHSDGEPLAVLRGHAGQAWDVDFTEDGEFLWSGAYDRMVRRWPVRTERLLEAARSLVDRSLTAGERERYSAYFGR